MSSSLCSLPLRGMNTFSQGPWQGLWPHCSVINADLTPGARHRSSHLQSHLCRQGARLHVADEDAGFLDGATGDAVGDGKGRRGCAPAAHDCSRSPAPLSLGAPHRVTESSGATALHYALPQSPCPPCFHCSLAPQLQKAPCNPCAPSPHSMEQHAAFFYWWHFLVYS